MSSCGLLFVFIYSSAAVFTIVDGQSTTDDSQDDVSVVEQLATLRAKQAALQAEVEMLKTRQPSSTTGTSGVTYVRWGRLGCENNGATLLYKGYAAGKHYYRNGGGSNRLCLPEQPQWKNHTTATGSSGWLYGTEYRLLTNHDALFSNGGRSVFHGKPTPCAVCYVPQRSARLMIPASNTCPVGWTREYDGYLMSEHSQQPGATSYAHHSTSYICIDSSPEIAVGSTVQTQALLYFVKVGCGTLPCSKYHNGREVTCVVCTK